MGETGNAKTACQKLLNKMLGEHTYLAQETANSVPRNPTLLAKDTIRKNIIKIYPDITDTIRGLEHYIVSVLPQYGPIRWLTDQKWLFQLGGGPKYPTLSVSFQTLHLAPEGMRGLEVGENDMDNPEECTVTASGDLWLQRYTNRPAELEALSMQELFTQYSWVNKQWHRLQGISSDQGPPAPFLSLEEVTWMALWATCAINGHIRLRDTLGFWILENKEEEEEEDDDEELFTQLFLNARVPLTNELGTQPIDDAWDVEAMHRQWDDIELMKDWIHEQ
ncbi:hypothetical protein C8F01DRAFT_1076997 [Mycena amicta]|nr:hypothetical protein C8F01DRAFT_1076997 [Mycena amicta]